jgi:hypothetical protein
MGREVITDEDVKKAQRREDAAGKLAAGGRKPPPKRDDYSDRLIKYIPAEIVSVYLFVSGILRTAGDQVPASTRNWLEWGVLIFLAGMTPVYLRRLQGVRKKQQWAIVTVSFVIWVFTLGGPFAQLGWYRPLYGALLLPLYTFTIATFKAEK